MQAANFLQLNNIVDECCRFLQCRLQSQNVLGIRSFAMALGCVSLVLSAGKRALKRFMLKFCKVWQLPLLVQVYYKQFCKVVVSCLYMQFYKVMITCISFTLGKRRDETLLLVRNWWRILLWNVRPMTAMEIIDINLKGLFRNILEQLICVFSCVVHFAFVLKPSVFGLSSR